MTDSWFEFEKPDRPGLLAGMFLLGVLGVDANGQALAEASDRVRVQAVVADDFERPVDGAAVIDRAEVEAVVGTDGIVSLDAPIDGGTESVQLTAVRTGRGGNHSGQLEVERLNGEQSQDEGRITIANDEGCDLQWLPGFGGTQGPDGHVSALAVFDDGNGPALYAAGSFQHASGVPVNRIARFDGDGWTPIGGTDGTVSSLQVFDDGSGDGPALYVGGKFSTVGSANATNIARWDGKDWSDLDGGVEGGSAVQSAQVVAMTVFDDGTGSDLYVGGIFESAGEQTVNQVARWDGNAWSALGVGLNGGTNPFVSDFQVFDDGSGNDAILYVGGSFQSAGGVDADNIARWNGSAWSALTSELNGAVRSMTTFDLGAGEALYATGPFTQAGSQTVNGIARWDGATWSALGSGIDYEEGTAQGRELQVFDDGSGPALYVGGEFDSAGGVASDRVAKWDGVSWSGLDGGVSDGSYQIVSAMLPYDDGSGHGERLYVGGSFGQAGNAIAENLAIWDDASWWVPGQGFNHVVFDISVLDDGSGPALYSGGNFAFAGGIAANRVARWDGSYWQALGEGMDGTVIAFEVFDDGNGPALYAGGIFSEADGETVNAIAKWNGQQWTSLGDGVGDPYGFGLGVHALQVFDDGDGPQLYAAGRFGQAGEIYANNIASWDGSEWHPVGTGVVFDANPEHVFVEALEVFDDGSGEGPALYVAGQFSTAGGDDASHIARWDGSSWSEVGAGLSRAARSLKVVDDAFGEGPSLFVGGNFTSAGPTPANAVARWDGSAWASLGSGIEDDSQPLPGVFGLEWFDDGTGPALYAAGDFDIAGGEVANRIARWDGAGWTPLGSGMSGGSIFQRVDSLAVFPGDSGENDTLFAAGDFYATGGISASYLGQWGCLVLPDAMFRDRFESM
ncbi:hypothetical protein IC757_12305 [Wenzhouxiangella sp. AB-CW3]|uniref:hypothetical protein n=1 Tax=Wenzhouxiangella sp. AB-CW3 TaxID=2771012 RepID=UPI00168B7EA7|nr:hypothetical protein [Wenzhouxiangella sp. AB-CW3]QOC21811.1 hypothetical protein IC757_12305 [Wenzhouxiangella sp. AB-CW3]